MIVKIIIQNLIGKGLQSNVFIEKKRNQPQLTSFN